MGSKFFGGKVDELQHYLCTIVAACDESLRLFTVGQQQPDGLGRIVVYGFSSFANVVQTLKDSATSLVGQAVTWGDVKQIRHGSFMHGCRNAATHDGNPIITAWVDGFFRVPAAITRFDGYGKVISIPAPQADIRTVCLQFSLDFSLLLQSLLVSALNAPHLQGAIFYLDGLREITESEVMPDFAKQMLRNNWNAVQEAIAQIKRDPVQIAIAKLEEVTLFCTERLPTT